MVCRHVGKNGCMIVEKQGGAVRKLKFGQGTSFMIQHDDNFHNKIKTKADGSDLARAGGVGNGAEKQLYAVSAADKGVLTSHAAVACASKHLPFSLLEHKGSGASVWDKGSLCGDGEDRTSCGKQRYRQY